MKECKSCKTQINEKAKKCPNCQADQRNYFKRHKILTGVLGLILLVIVISAASGGGDKNTSKAAGTNQAQSNEAPTQITADQLADEFDANQVSAEGKWKNKLVQFTETITNITDSGISFSGIGAKEFSATQISCRVSNKDDLMSIQNGQQVTVKGRIGGQTIGVIDMKDCSVVK